MIRPMAASRVFISYSHDSQEHCDRVFALAQQLRRDGVDAELDQFHQDELLHWPRWCEEQMRPDNSDFVICVCTPEYKRRVEGRAAADVGKGVFWEGTLLYSYLYDEKGNQRCIPVLISRGEDADIPQILSGYTRFCLSSFDLADTRSDYAGLYRLLTRQPSARPGELGQPKKLQPLGEKERQTDFVKLTGQVLAGISDVRSDTTEILEILQDRSRPLPFGDDLAELLQKAHDAASEHAANWLSHPRLAAKPLVTLQAVKLDEEGKETRELLDLASIEGSLMEGRRIVLEAPGGRGKTTTLVQLAQRLCKSARLAFLVDLPSWVRSRQNILEFIAHMPPFRSRSIDGGKLARLYSAEHFSFLLNGWNEISETYSEEAPRALAQLERSFPAAGIIVATRTHHISPPLPGSFRAKLLPLNRAQRTEYLKLSLPDQAEALDSQLDANHVLDELTRTPLILAEVATIFRSGAAIPTTKMGVLGSVTKLLQHSEEHRDHLQRPPLTGQASDYLTELSVQMTTRGDVTISEQRARSICCSVSFRLRASGQIATLSEPASVLPNTLYAHHVLERIEYPWVAFRFQHQQFQEFYAVLS
jgi:hypothetical protein